ncbi:MAG: HPr(Ser) kinase/phosphatase [Longimicrobiales bacterium]
MPPITIDDLLRVKGESLQLELLNPSADVSREILEPSISSPGLVLAGYTGRIPRGRLQVLGETEIMFLCSLDEAKARELLSAFLRLPMPAVVVTKGQTIPPPLIEVTDELGVPLLRSSLKTGEFYRRIQPFLEFCFAPTTTVHGSLADVYGVGLLFIGQSGIGKSECVLDLVERGHRLVADDVVYITRRGNDVLIGRGHELQRHHMEIRGIGIIDIPALFGVRSIRQQKRIEVVVQLEEWSDGAAYDRTGLDSQQVEYLGVHLPMVTVPLNPGKNITVISEVVAMNHLLKYSGIDTAALFNERLKEAMRPVREYLEQDYE